MPAWIAVDSRERRCPAEPLPRIDSPDCRILVAVNLAFLREAILLSRDKMQANEGGPFGALVVREGAIIGRGWNRVTSACDPTAHAEIVAIRDACSRLRTFRLDHCEIYCSCEPCPLCLAAIYWSRIGRIYYAAGCADAAAAGFDDSFVYQEVSKPPGERSILMEQALRDEAVAVMEAWTKKADRIPY
jgi:tRNA(Arg) A34 adenosine deaminase TadA